MRSGVKIKKVDGKLYLVNDWTVSNMELLGCDDFGSVEMYLPKYKVNSETVSKYLVNLLKTIGIGKKIYMYDSDLDERNGIVMDLGKTNMYMTLNAKNGEVEFVSNVKYLVKVPGHTYYFKDLKEAYYDVMFNVQMLWRLVFNWGCETVDEETIKARGIGSGCYNCGTKFSHSMYKRALRERSCPVCGENFLKNRYTWKLPEDTEWNNKTFMTPMECVEDALKNGVELGSRIIRGQVNRVKIEDCIDWIETEVESSERASETGLEKLSEKEKSSLWNLIREEVAKEYSKAAMYKIEELKGMY